MITTPAPIPLTVVGGFLGAGKTTFLNHILRSGSARYAVLVNDFGAVNIDADLIARHDGATTTLTNGCVCCSIGAGFIETLGRILDSADPFDHIIIESSGVGDPWRIAEIALIEPMLRLNAVIVLADASRIEALLFDPRVGDTVRTQFDRCNLVLLNKTDLLDRDATLAARSALSFIRDDLTIIETSQHAMPALPLLQPTSAGSFRADEALRHANHERVFRRWSYQRPARFDRARLGAALDRLPAQLLRLKGLCSFDDDTGTSVLQMVERTWSLTPHNTDEFPSQTGINLVGVGTEDLPDTNQLDDILNHALA